MKKNSTVAKKLFLVVLLAFISYEGFSQMKTYAWDTYKIKFKVPETFTVEITNVNAWVGYDNTLTLAVYPRKNEYLPQEGIKKALYNWMVNNGVTNIDEGTEIDPEKMNRYSGFLHEGTVDNYKVEAALLVDPDYPNISFYIFIKYTNERLDDVINILSSFAPII